MDYFSERIPQTDASRTPPLANMSASGQKRTFGATTDSTIEEHGADLSQLKSREVHLTNHCAQAEALFIYEAQQGVR